MSDFKKYIHYKKNYFYVVKNLNRNNKIVLQKMFALNWDVSIKALNE